MTDVTGKASAAGLLLVIELIGPLVDDGGAIVAAITAPLLRAGLELRPGAVDQVAGMAPEHAIRTLVEGHGRFELLEELDELVLAAEQGIAAWAQSGAVRADPQALDGWRHLAAAGASLAVLTAIPGDLAARAAERVGLVVHDSEWLVAADGRGVPHPDHLTALTGAGNAVALVGSIGAGLAVAAARCREVIAVGSAPGAALFADITVPGIAGPGSPLWQHITSRSA